MHDPETSATSDASPTPTPSWRRRLVGSLYVQVLIAIALGVLVGASFPPVADQLKPIGDGFVKLIKMLIGPVVFMTVVLGIASMGDMKRVGRVGFKALVYFEVLSTLSLFIGLLVATYLQPGAGIHASPAQLSTKGLEAYTTAAHSLSAVDFLMNIIPSTFVGAFTGGDILQVLLIAILFGLSLSAFGEKGRPLLDVFSQVSNVLFGIVNMVMRLAPLGAFAAMAYTVGKFGLQALLSLGLLLAGVYLTCVVFVFGVLGLIAWLNGFNLLKFLRYISDAILLVLATSSSESALPLMMEKLEALGCSKSVVGLVIPTGYSFNLDGTSIYLTMATVFVAQALHVPLSLGQELSILAVLMLTSKGAAAVTGGGFVTLAATLSAIGTIPVAGLTLLLGVDRFMSEARAITNLIGNGVATIVVARWEREYDAERARRVLDGQDPVELSSAHSHA